MVSFHEFLGRRSTAQLLDRMLADNARVDEELQRRKAQNEETYNRAIRTMFDRPEGRQMAIDQHHIEPRSLGGKWQTFNILSACWGHHSWFKAQLIEVEGNPNDGPVKVVLTRLGKLAGIKVPKRRAA